MMKIVREHIPERPTSVISLNPPIIATRTYYNYCSAELLRRRETDQESRPSLVAIKQTATPTQQGCDCRHEPEVLVLYLKRPRVKIYRSGS